MTSWKWNRNRKRQGNLLAINQAPSCTSLSSAEMFADDKIHRKEMPMQTPPPSPEAPKLHPPKTLNKESTSTTQDTQNSSNSSQHSVRFSDVEIRPYRITLGDNAWTDMPLGLDWDYDEPERYSVDEFEEAQHNKADSYKTANDYEPLTMQERYDRLRKAGYTHNQIRQMDRRRKIELIMAWAYRKNREELTPSPFCNGHVYLQRYVI
ncbi:hypothetical protein MPSEU_000041300 [Mayamaea pseudoterrestris]|nr:hypothetical protein MPSEU_000041300 [Mayamaea pseudoterrestris]